ncbi:hypothetical protein AKJ51_04575 [candidate division MSBL1 archaeon SCGC-AAA382A20]|uniref:Zinc-ribbon domain-containing protein n=1 Tax=candidate division MSBL1 archaeon SCGC-AAA382A20 TaxID=1698280 RepID=A0A133VHH9_9EURY|nr:hypothetical protein AKJ51_04575 [candidate division MSBL1 archaeon SCGC-AAA382A20]
MIPFFLVFILENLFNNQYAKLFPIFFIYYLLKMPQCRKCGRKISDAEDFCPFCGEPVSSRDAELLREIESFKEKRNQILAIFVLSMFGIMIIPLRNLALVLAIISFGIAVPMGIYYAWKKRQAENRLEEL